MMIEITHSRHTKNNLAVHKLNKAAGDTRWEYDPDTWADECINLRDMTKEELWQLRDDVNLLMKDKGNTNE